MLKSIALALAVALTPVAVSASETVPPDAPPYYDILVGTLHEDDRDAMEGWETDLRDRLGEIAAGPVDGQTAGWITEILEVIDAERLPIAEDTELLGHWQVRSMQADDLGAYVYSWFPAFVFREARALVFDKNSGSQRHRGLMALAPDHQHYLFAGALYYGYEQTRMYSGHTDAANASREMDAIAHVYKIGPDHFIMAFAPEGERFRLYEMRR